MNDALRVSLQSHLGDRVRPLDDGRLAVAPANEAELKVVIAQFRSFGASLRDEGVLSRAALSRIEQVQANTALVTAQSGATLEAIDRAALAFGLTLGPLSPGARSLSLAEFLEGPHAGLRAVLGGRLESVALSLEAILEGGLGYQSRPAPRSAAGPDLDALLLGGEGRLGLISRATVRLLPRPAAIARTVSSFPDTRSLARAARRMLAAGCDVQRGFLQKRNDRYVLELELGGTVESLERDRSTCAQLAADAGGRASGQSAAAVTPGEERVLRWEEVAAELEGGQPLALYRLAAEAVIAMGATRGVPLAPQPWAHPELWNGLVRAALETHFGGGE